MPSPAFKRVEDLFHQAAALDPGRRPAFLDAACAGDPDLRAAVETLLRYDNGRDNESFLLVPLVDKVETESARAAEFPTHPAAPQHAGTDPGRPHIPGYILLEELGRGGMGVVYKARQTDLNRVVALKMLLPASPPTPEQLGRFRTEAEALARLHHPNIVPIYEIGEAEGRPYFTMEYVPGPSLAQVLDGRPQDVAGSAHLIEVLARAVHALHQQGIVHRDLKPANILLQSLTAEPAEKKPGRTITASQHLSSPSAFSFPSVSSAVSAAGNPLVPKITDFGLAKDLTTGRNLTESGTALGTPNYMAPEQVRSGSGGVGAGADIYALGSILYELLTGRPPFDAATAAETLAQLLRDDPISPARLRPRLPQNLVTICLKCLEKSPANRYASAWDLADDLRRFQAGEPVQAHSISLPGRAIRWCRRRSLVAALGGLSILMALALLVTVLVYNARLHDALARLEAKTEEQRQQIVQLNVNIGLDGMEQGDVFAAVLRFTEALRLDQGNPEHEHHHRTRIANALRKCPRLLAFYQSGHPVLCSHVGNSGGWLVTASADHLVQVRDIMTGQPTCAALQLEDTPLHGVLSPDGRSLAMISPRGTARVWSLPNGTFRELPSTGSAVRQITFHPDGRCLLTQDADAAIHVWDLTPHQPVTLWQVSANEVALAAPSDDGRWLLTVNPDQLGQVWDLATGKEMGPQLKLDHPSTQAALGPDGRTIALLGVDGSLRIWDVAMAGWLGSPMQPRQGVRRMMFTPDGAYILTTGKGPAIQVWQVQTGKRVASSSPVGLVSQTHFSPVGPSGSVTLGEGGKKVITFSQDGMVRVWGLPTKDYAPTLDIRPIADLMALAQVMSGSRIDENQERRWLDIEALHTTWANLKSAP
jgi:eukaryotic-like serine/threonine-protein kinase